jgi:transposase
MATPLSLLPYPDHDDAKHGRRYSTAEREAAFELWYQRRSRRKAAAELGVALSTVERWAGEGRWEERARALDAELAEAGRARAKALVLPIADELLANLRAIALDAGAATMGRVRATELLLGYCGLVPAKQSDPAWAPAPPAPDAGLPLTAAEMSRWTPLDWARFRATGKRPALPAPPVEAG